MTTPRRRRRITYGLTLAAVVSSPGCRAAAPVPDEYTGTLSGFHHFEAQCAYLEMDEGRLSLRVPDGMRLRISADRPEEDDVAVLASDGTVLATEGDPIHAVGTVEEPPSGSPCGEDGVLRATELRAPGQPIGPRP